MLEACLESHGVNVKELHSAPVDMSTELCYNTATSRGPMRMDSHMRRNSGEQSHPPRSLSFETIMAKAASSVLPFVHPVRGVYTERCEPLTSRHRCCKA